MTTETFVSSPVYQVSPQNVGAGDLELYKDGNSTAWVSNSMNVAGLASGKVFRDFGVFARFEPTMPDDAIIDGVRLDFISYGATGGQIRSEAGFMVRDGVWDLAAGWSGYTNRNDVPFPFYDNGVGVDLAAWWDGAPAFNWVSNTVLDGDVAAGTLITLGDGIASTDPVTGLVAQLQSYWADPGNRSARVGGAIPLAFHIHPGSHAAGVQPGLNLKTGQVAASDVAITIEWHSADSPKGVESEGFIGPVIGSETFIGPVLEAETSISGVIESRTSIGTVIESETEIAPAIKSKGEIK